jgi:hypothetical protein
MVKDTNGIWNSFKPNWAQAYLEFQDGHRVLIPICKQCFETPDIEKLTDSLLHEESEGYNEKTKEFLKFKKVKKPVSKDEVIAFGKRFKKSPEGFDTKKEKNFVVINGENFIESSEEDQFEISPRGYPLKIERWKPVRKQNGN